MEFCTSTKASLKGAVVQVKVYTESESVCEQVKEIVDSVSMSDVIGIISRHGGCEIESESPLIVRTCDGEIEVIVTPANLLARMAWGKAVEKVRDHCNGC